MVVSVIVNGNCGSYTIKLGTGGRQQTDLKRIMEGKSGVLPNHFNFGNSVILHANPKKYRVTADLTVFGIFLAAGRCINDYSYLFQAVRTGHEITV